MAYEPIPKPLHTVLQTILHANLFTTWRSDLTSWEIAHPDQAANLRAQLAYYALTDAVEPDYFKRLSGHWVTDVDSTQAWFSQLYKQFYGRAPERRDFEVKN